MKNMRERARRSAAAALIALGLGAFPAGAAAPQAPPPQPSFPAEAEIVVVDVVVSDRRGEPVTDLTAADFVVKDEGAAQAVTAFELVHRPAPAVGTAAPPAPPPPPRVSSNRTGEARATRAFMIVFDDLHVDMAQAQRARVAARDFLDTGVSAGDLVGVVATGTDASWVGRMPDARAGLLQVLTDEKAGALLDQHASVAARRTGTDCERRTLRTTASGRSTLWGSTGLRATAKLRRPRKAGGNGCSRMPWRPKGRQTGGRRCAACCRKTKPDCVCRRGNGAR